MTSYFKNWHKSNTNLKHGYISESFPVSVYKHGINGLSIIFQDGYGKRMEFVLNEHDTQLMLMHIDTRILGKEFKQENYPLLYKDIPITS